jgi:hypothetical protein
VSRSWFLRLVEAFCRIDEVGFLGHLRSFVDLIFVHIGYPDPERLTQNMPTIVIVMRISCSLKRQIDNVSSQIDRAREAVKLSPVSSEP